MKTSETLDMDSLIDLDDETTISYNTTEEFQVENDQDSVFTVKYDEKVKNTHSSIDANSSTVHNDDSTVMNSPETGYNDDLTTSILTSVQNTLTDDHVKRKQTPQDESDSILTTNNEEKSSSSTIDIDELIMKEKSMQKSSTIQNLLRIIHDIHDEEPRVNDVPTVYNPIEIQTEQESKFNVVHSNEYSFEVSKDNPTEPIETDYIDESKNKDLSTLSQEFSVEPSTEDNNLTIDISNIPSLIKFSSKLQDNLPTPPSSPSFINDPSPINDHSIIEDENENVQSLINEISDSSEIIYDGDLDFEKLYQRYLTNLDQYQKMIQQISEFEQYEKALSPIAEESTILFERIFNDKAIKTNDMEKSFSVTTVKRQANHIGHYGFELEQTADKKIIVSSIIDSTYCPNLNVNDEIIGIDNTFIIISLEQCHLLFHSLWHNEHEYVQILINKPSQRLTTPGK